MIKSLVLISTFGVCMSLNAQRVKLLENDNLTYYVDTKDKLDVKWAPDLIDINSYSITDGKANTTAIVSALGLGDYAAYHCDTSKLENYTDWYLPSFQEAKDIYNLQFSILPYLQTRYWTSTRVAGQFWAYTQIFGKTPDVEYVGTGMTRVYSYFCIRKEVKITTGLIDDQSKQIESTNFTLYDLNGKHTEKAINKILIKKYENGSVEKIIYTE